MQALYFSINSPIFPLPIPAIAPFEKGETMPPRKVYFNFRRKLDRRTLLRGAGVAMALPWLSAMENTFGASQSTNVPRRFVAFSQPYSFLPGNFFPEGEGVNYTPSRYLQEMREIRDEFTVISGCYHPGVFGGHFSEASLLSAAPFQVNGVTRKTISIDQLLASQLGSATRLQSLVLSCNGTQSSSVTSNGAMVPAESSASKIFHELFVDDTPAERSRKLQQLQHQKSVLDRVSEDAKSLARKLGAGDRNQLEAYFYSVRELEKRIHNMETWVDASKPKVTMAAPSKTPGELEQFRTMCDLMRLALETDSTRFAVLSIGFGKGVPDFPGISERYHNLTHHGKNAENLKQLALIETEIIRTFTQFVSSLKKTQGSHGPLLDSTSTLLLSNLGNAASHSVRDLPVLLAGGGFKHGQHIKQNNYPLANLFLSIAQRTGLEIDSFGSSTGTMQGLEPV
ncbi:DUF1552 domain-containing protein [Bremerella sp. P1]|uniref:DUF1552 domain-containing protein n=1 Tax=Bremerella sp. P1 TaxID=3026424 RepID=UPI002368BF4C|nr:DUF1552 domain-containing protein [Bremerella sp. P1]WDI43761.1 DUF1552 domain-containing protein [Bremerella sp. P1]